MDGYAAILDLQTFDSVAEVIPETFLLPGLLDQVDVLDPPEPGVGQRDTDPIH